MKTLTNVVYVMSAPAENPNVLEPIFFDENNFDASKQAKLTTIDLCKTAINNVPQGGILPDAMFKRLQVLNKLQGNEEPGSNIRFEDSEFETLKSCVNELRFNMVDANLYHFVQQINDLK